MIAFLAPVLDHMANVSGVTVALDRVGNSWPWYITRAAGFVAAGLLVLLMLSGIGQVTGIIYRYIEPIKVWAIHKALAIALCVSIVLHVGFLLIDKYLPFSLVQILVPFASTHNNGTQIGGFSLGALAVTFGVLAMYGVVIVVSSALGWINKNKTWRKLHYISYAVIILVLLHGLYIGTDLKYGIFRDAWIGVGAVLALAIIMRLWRKGTIKKALQDDSIDS